MPKLELESVVTAQPAQYRQAMPQVAMSVLLARMPLEAPAYARHVLRVALHRGSRRPLGAGDAVLGRMPRPGPLHVFSAQPGAQALQRRHNARCAALGHSLWRVLALV